jgi:hypothetical protein
VHPLAVAPGLDDSGTAEIGQVPGYLWLPLLQNLHEVADANLLISHKVKQTETRIVSQSLKKALHIELRRFCRHALLIRIDEYVGKGYSRFYEYVFRSTP